MASRSHKNGGVEFQGFGFMARSTSGLGFLRLLAIAGNPRFAFRVPGPLAPDVLHICAPADLHDAYSSFTVYTTHTYR